MGDNACSIWTRTTRWVSPVALKKCRTGLCVTRTQVVVDGAMRNWRARHGTTDALHGGG